ncbi:MAG: hypothetical protein REI94_06660 [Moraxellaceae bacterium]|nr:hypothetical protein [Moraxellaceae bacterium]
MFRALLVCLLALSVPVQGVAALLASGSPMQMQDLSGTDQASCHAAQSAAGTDDGHPTHHAAADKLKACGGCYGTLLDLVSLPVMSAPLGSDVLVSRSSDALSGHIPAGLERPPRNIS